MSIVWIQMPGYDDNPTTAKAIAESIKDPRVRHFYDPLASHRAGKAFAKKLIKPGRGVAWDIYMFYEKGIIWDEGPPPMPVEYSHQLGGGRRADPAHWHPGEKLVEQLHEAMHKVTGAECAG